MFLAFCGATENSLFGLNNSVYTAQFVFLRMTIPYWIFKVLFALGDIPFCYLGVRSLKGSKNKA